MSAAVPRLIVAAAPPAPRGVVLVLHGGREHGTGLVKPWQLAVLRLVPVAREVVRQANGSVAVLRLLYRRRGWNSPELPALEDARWALAECRHRYGAHLPISMIGHSMGGRVALRIGDEDGVRGIVGLAPWLKPHDPHRQLGGRRILIEHGLSDRTTDPAQAQRFVAALAGVATSAAFVRIPDEGHALLRHRRQVDGLAASFALRTLGIGWDGQSEAGAESNLLRRVLAGGETLTL